MYAGDNRNNPDGNLYSFKNYQIVAAHEFGHILGIKGGYNNPKGRDAWSIMSKQWETGRATLIDIQKALQAWSTGRVQGWK